MLVTRSNLLVIKFCVYFEIFFKEVLHSVERQGIQNKTFLYSLCEYLGNDLVDDKYQLQAIISFRIRQTKQ